MSVPYGALALLGYRPDVIETARGVNLLYQFWIHTEAIGSIGRLQEVFNSPSAHRVHHGSNRQYLDRNHGSILIVWDRLFGTHALEEEPVAYGLTRNVDSFNLARVASHEWVDIVRDVGRADGWGERLGYALRGPGWAYERDAARGEPAAAGVS
jgi:sterol desaturase/sphingolipid hydroxylase (fatty acid hydroxylase superfamily)